jgi:hypothetical protein
MIIVVERRHSRWRSWAGRQARFDQPGAREVGNCSVEARTELVVPSVCARNLLVVRLVLLPSPVEEAVVGLTSAGHAAQRCSATVMCKEKSRRATCSFVL